MKLSWRTVFLAWAFLFGLPALVSVLVKEWPMPEPKAPNSTTTIASIADDALECGRKELDQLAPELSQSVRASTQWFVSTTGSGTACSIGSPCSLYTAWCGHNCTPAINFASGDTVWIEAGDYKLTVGGNGGRTTTAQAWLNYNKGVTFRNYQNGKVTIDLNVDLSGTSVGQNSFGEFYATTGFGSNTYWGLILYNSNNNHTRSVTVVSQWPFSQNQLLIGAPNSKVINCFIYDGVDGIQKNGGNSNAAGTGGGNLIQGNFFQYSGFIAEYTGYFRGAGHGHYIENPNVDGQVADTSTFDGDVVLRSFDVSTQMFTATSTVSYITYTNNMDAANGICSGQTACNDPSSWPAIDCCANIWSFGASGGAASLANCQNVPGTKCLINADVESNWVMGSGNQIALGFQKGLYNDIWKNNTFFTTGGQSVTCCTANGTGTCASDPSCTVSTPCGFFLPQTITGNTFYTSMNGGGCPAGPFNLTNFPSNTANSGFPTSGTIFKYWVDPNETGRGHVGVANFDSVKPTTVSINLDSMGGFAGEQYRIQQWQDLDPYNAAKDVATGTCSATCGSVSVNTVAASIRQPAFTRNDGSTPFPVPPDLWGTNAPRYAVFFLYPRWEAAAGTPTPTSTFTNTPTLTPTNTPTFTPTATLTPTPTSAATKTPTFTPSSTNTPAPTLTPTPTATATPTPSAINSTGFGVNQCKVFAPMALTADATAISGFHASSTVPNNGDLVCTFNVPADGVYRAWVHVSAQDPNADSYFEEVDGDNGFNSLTPTPTPSGNTPTPTPAPASTHVFDTMESQQMCIGPPTCQYSTQGWPSPGFVWNMLNDRTAGNCAGTGTCTGNFTERDLTLTVAGNPHTIAFRSREAGSPTNETARIDWIQLTTCLTCDAPSFGGPTPTPGPNNCPRTFLCKGRHVRVFQPCNQPPMPPCQP